MKFEFRAFDQEGNLKSGVVDAPDQASAFQILSQQNLVITQIKPLPALRLFILFRKVSLRELALFTRELHYLVKARILVDEAVRTLYQGTTNESFKRILFDVYSELQAGASLSQALSRFPDTFTPFYVRFVRIGEVSGTLEDVLKLLAEHLENQNKFIGKLLQASFYPLLVLIIFLATMLILSVQIMPQVIKIFQEAKAPVPIMTLIFASTASFLFQNWPYVLVILILSFWYGFRYFQTDEGKRFLFDLVNRLPVFGTLLREIYLSRFLEGLSFLIQGGLPIGETLEILAESIDHPLYTEAISAVADDTKRGMNVYESLARFPQLFPSLVITAVQTGEKTAELKEVLDTMRLYFYEDINTKTQTLGETIQPLMILILAGGLAFLELSLLVPLLKLTSVMQTI
jgi:type II secretory pathway component PulF